MGKTALATNIAYNAAQNILSRQEKSSVAFFSLKCHQSSCQLEYYLSKQELNQILLDKEMLQKKKLIDILKPQEIFIIYHFYR